MEPLKSKDPKSVGQWTLIARLGAGGMGVVYLATKGTQNAALKVIHGHLIDDENWLIRFQREIEVLTRIKSDYVACILESDVMSDSAWVATEFVDGPDLKSEIEINGKLSAQKWMGLAIGLSRAIADVHAAGIIHRDIKPGNVIFSRSGPKLIDFGISLMSESTSLTTTGLVTGSPAWLSPEQIAGSAITQATDLFALGSLLTYAAKGFSPWSDSIDTTTPAFFHRILTESPDLSGLNELQKQVIEKLLDKEPKDRPNAKDIIKTLELNINSRSYQSEIAGGTDSIEKVKKELREQKKNLKYPNIPSAPQQINTELTQTEIIYRQPIQQKSNSRKKLIVIALSIAASLVAGIGLFQIIDVSSNSDSFEQASIQNSNESIAKSVQSEDTPENNNNIDSESISPAANPSPSDSNIPEPSQAEVEESEPKTEVKPSPDTSKNKSISKNKGQVCRTIDKPGMPTSCWAIGSKAKISACIVQGESYTVTAKFFKEGQQIDSDSTPIIGNTGSNGEICNVSEGKAPGKYDVNVPYIDPDFLSVRQIDMVGWIVQGQGFNQTMTDFYTWK